MLSRDNYGSITMVADPARPSDLFTQFHMASHGPARSNMAEPGPAEREGSRLREVRMDSRQSSIRLAFAAPGLEITDGGVSSTKNRVAPADTAPTGNHTTRKHSAMSMTFDAQNGVVFSSNWNAGVWKLVTGN